jgi:uncharacterized protein YdeI (YjbR/CyaY-like superfamily)
MTARAHHFPTTAAFRAWLEKNHDKVPELLVGFYKKGSGRPSVTYPEALDEALCFGWIDGVRKSVDDETYTVRFTPRRAKSYWSAVNTKKYAALEARGLVRPAGQAAFERRDTKAAGRYSFEQRPERLPAVYEKTFRADKAAWEFFAAQPPGYRRMATWFVVSAVKEETRQTRLATLMAESRRRRRIGLSTKVGTSKKR